MEVDGDFLIHQIFFTMVCEDDNFGGLATCFF